MDEQSIRFGCRNRNSHGLFFILLDAILLIIVTLLPMPSQSQTTADCSKLKPTSPDFLSCTAQVLAGTSDAPPASPGGLNHLLQSYLSVLAASVGYPGRSEDLDILKRRSTDLKRRDAHANRDAIAALDSAISSHIYELRSVMSPAIVGDQISPTTRPTNIFPDFVQRKIAYLDSENRKFYEKGPFEIISRVDLANALQELYFISKVAGNDDLSKMKRAEELISGTIPLVTSSGPDYLSTRDIATWINDLRFRNSVLLFYLGNREKLRAISATLAIDNANFSLGARNIPHIYIYKVFETPYVLSVLAGSDKDGHSNLKTDDPAIIKRFYNPAQLGLFMCSRADTAGPSSFEQLTKDIGDLVLSDYYVVAASTNDKHVLEDFRGQITTTIGSSAVASQRDGVLQRLADLEVSGFSSSMRRGARLCGLQDNVRDKIYTAFTFAPTVQEIDGFGRYRFHLLFGGRLNANQARVVSDFLNRVIFPSMKQKREMYHLENSAYIARMRINE